MKKRYAFPIIIIMAIVCLTPLNAGAKTCPDGEHVWNKWWTFSSTYSKEGSKVRYCLVCDKEEEIVIPVKSTTSKQKKVKKVVDKFFTAAQVYDTAKMKSCFSSSAKPELFVNKKYMAKFMKKMNKKLSYDITKIKVSGKKAVVTVDCIYRKASAAYKKAFDDVVLYLMINPNASDSAIDKFQYQRTLQYYKELEKDYCDKTIKINLKKTNGKWKISKWTDELANAVHANYNKAYNNYFNF